jgi:hypothetical protein
MMPPSLEWTERVRVPFQGAFFGESLSHGVAMGCR